PGWLERRRPHCCGHRLRRILRLVRELAARAPDQVPHGDADELRTLVRRPPAGALRRDAPGSELPSRQDSDQVPAALPRALAPRDAGPLARLRPPQPGLERESAELARFKPRADRESSRG